LGFQKPLRPTGRAASALNFRRFKLGKIRAKVELRDRLYTIEATCEERIVAAIIRDVVGNPFRPVPFDPTWRTLQVLAVAGTIYDERRFEELPVLADALEDAGCHDTDTLNHCRQPGDHVRGCWVLDQLLGKQ
jgi:hypothetical protein